MGKIDETKLYNSHTKAHITVDLSFDQNLVDPLAGGAGAGTTTYNLHAILESEAMMTLGSNKERLIPQA